MSQEIQHYCPGCETERTFNRAASAHLHLGLKTKWWCGECGYGMVLVDGDIDSTVEA